MVDESATSRGMSAHRWCLRPLQRGADYAATREAMAEFTQTREADTPDELWPVEHPPVFTLGQAGKDMHVLSPGDIPVVRVERGGQVTYHGPGQLVVYVLVDLRRRNITVKGLVHELESSLIAVLAQYGISSERKDNAPGVYVRSPEGEHEKIAALGLKISRGCSWHGLALNIDMDLSPYQRINPCGYAGLITTDMSTVLRRNGQTLCLSLDALCPLMLNSIKTHIDRLRA